MKSNKRILFIHHGVGLGGAPRSMAQLANKLKLEGVDVKVLFLKNSDAKSLLDDVDYHVVGLPLLYFNHSSRWYKWYELHLILFQFFSWFFTVFCVAPYWFLKIKPNTVYLNSSVLTDWLIVAKIMKIKNILHVRESISNGHLGIRNNLIRVILNKCADKIIFLSQHNRNRLGKLKDNVSIIHNYVNEPSPPNKIESKVYDIIYVGGEREIKGFSLVKRLLKDNSDLSFCMLGYYSLEFEEEFSNHPNIVIKGAVKNSLEYIRKSKFLLFPATTPHFPRPVIEALSCGTIPIMSDLEGAQEIITDGKDGFFFESENYSSMKNLITTLGTIDKEKIISNGRNSFDNKFSMINESKILNIIRNLNNVVAPTY
jgi:glycosyltransferase involved in cell wall biosynthesis